MTNWMPWCCNKTIVDDTRILEEQNRRISKFNEELKEQIEKAIKENRQKDLLLIQQAKMAELGTMIGAIAHQWKQPLNIIGLLSQNLADALDDDPLDKESLRNDSRKIFQQIRFMSQTVDDFRSFFKPNKEKELFRPCEVTREVLQLLSSFFDKRQIAVTIHPHTHFLTEGYPSEFKQVILNIFNNAKDAMEERQIAERRIDVRFIYDAGISTITIEDNAGGIPEELLPDKIFEPYTSTKGEGGTGIGLSLSRQIIEKIGGSIAVENKRGGASFIIKLPATPEVT